MAHLLQIACYRCCGSRACTASNHVSHSHLWRNMPPPCLRTTQSCKPQPYHPSHLFSLASPPLTRLSYTCRLWFSFSCLSSLLRHLFPAVWPPAGQAKVERERASTKLQPNLESKLFDPIAKPYWRKEHAHRRTKSASAGNRTRVTSMATMYSTTRPLMLLSSQQARVMAKSFAKTCIPHACCPNKHTKFARRRLTRLPHMARMTHLSECCAMTAVGLSLIHISEPTRPY